MNMSARDAYKLIDEMTLGQQQWSSVRGPVQDAPGVIETNISTKLATQLKTMQKSIDRLTNQNISVVHQSPTCAVCGGSDHLAINCNWGGSAEGDVKQVNALNNNYRPQNNPYSNSYNPGWRNHPNFSWKNNQDNQPQNQNQSSNQNRSNQGYWHRQFDQGAPQKSNLEQMMEKMMQEQAKFRQVQKRVNQQVADQIRDLGMKVDLLATQGKLLETQVAQLATSSSR
jgi:hypothetical protein